MRKIVLICTLALFFLHLEATKTINCQDEKCEICSSSSGCITTCEGPACENCPSGNCCRGNRCNICIDSLCCRTERCNYCVQRCGRGCSVNHIRSSKACHNKCSELCLQNHPTNETEPIKKTPLADAASSLSNNNLYNVTTIIKLFNYLNNTNIIETPVTINMTNTNNFTVSGTGMENDLEMSSQLSANKCCYIIHPEECPDEENKSVCFRRKHVECSDLCSSNYVLIRKEESLAINSTCVNVKSPPNSYCGQYVTENCQDCYGCGKESCTDQPTCSKNCKEAIIPEEFYNTPYQKNII